MPNINDALTSTLSTYHNSLVAPFLGQSSEVISQVNSLSTENSVQTSEVNSLNSAVATLSSLTAENLSEVDEDIDSLSGSLSTVESNIASTSTAQSTKDSTQDSSISSLSTSLSTVESEISSLQNSLSAKLVELDSLSSSLSEVASNVAATSTSQSTVDSTQNSNIASLSTENSTQDSNITSLSTAESTLDSEVTSMSNYIDSMSVGDLSDVDLTSPSDGQALVYDELTDKFMNKTVGGVGGGHDIEDSEGTEVPKRTTLQVESPLTVEDDDTYEKTILGVDTSGTIPLGGIIPPAETTEKWGHIYSTDEQVVGKWIDGKPIYEISLEGTSPNSLGTEETIASIPSNVDLIFISDGYLKASDNEYIPLNWNYSGSYIISTHVDKRSGIKMILKGGYNNKPVKIVIRYTKTTDTV